MPTHSICRPTAPKEAASPRPFAPRRRLRPRHVRRPSCCQQSPASVPPPFDLEHADWAATLAFANTLCAEAETAHAQAIAKLEQAQALWTRAAQAQGFNPAQRSSRALDLAQQYATRATAHRVDLAEIRRDAVVAMLDAQPTFDPQTATACSPEVDQNGVEDPAVPAEDWRSDAALQSYVIIDDF